MKYLSILGIIASTFLLGLYCASQFKYHIPIEPYKWVIAYVLLVMYIAMAYIEYKK